VETANFPVPPDEKRFDWDSFPRERLPLYTSSQLRISFVSRILTPIPSLLRKEGSAVDKVSNVMIKILPFRTEGVSILKQ
jgi:hypothetical protein